MSVASFSSFWQRFQCIKKARVISPVLMFYGAVASTHASNEGLHLDWMNPAISPQENFFLYANGQWQKDNPIPPHYASWGAFSLLMDQIEDLMHQLVINASQENAPSHSLAQKVGDFYLSGMDEAAIEKAGLTPLKPILDKINAFERIEELPRLVAELQLLGVDVFFNFGAMQDFKDSQKMIAGVFQGGLSLPDRDYYLQKGEKFDAVRQAFLTYMSTIFSLSGETAEEASAHAKRVLEIETQIAQASKPQSELRNPEAVYHLLSLKELSQMTPHFSWSAYFKALELKDISHVNIETPSFMTAEDQLWKTVAIEDWRLYLKWHLLASFANELPASFEDATFKMSQVLRGVKTQLPRWKRVLRQEENSLGFAIGELYIQHYAKESSRRQVMEMTENIYNVFQNELKNLHWMSQETRKAALAKLQLMKKRIGYPKTWWDYSSLDIVKSPYVVNVMRANIYLSKRDLHKIGRPVDPEEWYMAPQVVNAYYDPSMNHITIPMGILASPFYDENAPLAVNYGGIGAVIGHEITHGFDDQGAKFDGRGNLNNWWTKEDFEEFQRATACISDQFSTYKVSDLSVNGPLVVGEATADLGGLKIAYLAFHASKEYREAKTIEGLTPDQQFFLGFAHIWANNTRPEQARLWAITDPHPPAMYRVNGSLANLEAFKKAFGITSSSKENRCEVW